jgi:hypothetical protein
MHQPAIYISFDLHDLLSFLPSESPPTLPERLRLPSDIETNRLSVKNGGREVGV